MKRIILAILLVSQLAAASVAAIVDDPLCDLAVTKAGTILCFYGRGEKSSFAGDRLTLARFNLEWLTEGADSTPSPFPTSRP